MSNPPDPKTKPCPLCNRPAAPDTAPFCSRGCKDRDLLQWLGDGYRIPGPPADVGLDSDEGAR
ncbi:DNA gyrase inhibitor YacG [Sphingomonas sp. GCM10030256]|uniref:DNA gyrase inhibitor YacG n=1 Tax=Sphingomonas sp. GCM10030256 TaxID=3273427 RepID=UPI00361CB855